MDVQPHALHILADTQREQIAHYVAGKSAKRIATELNKVGIEAPTGGNWGFSTISGNPKPGTDILNKELYIGKLIWNRPRFIRYPDTGKRQARLNLESE